MKQEKTKEELQIEIDLLKLKISELENSESNSSDWLYNSPVCTKVLDLDFNLQYMSNAGVRALQIEDVTEFYGKPYPLYFFPEPFKKTMREYLLRAKETGETIVLEDEIQDLKGNKLWFQATITPVSNKQGKINHLLVVSIDTSARKLADEALRRSEEKFRAMVETSNDLIWVLDHNGNFTYLNKHAEKATGYLLADIVGKSFHSIVLKDELPFLREVFTKSMAGERISYELNLKTVNGKMLILAVNTAPLFTDADSVRSIFSFARDITAEKQAEEKLLQNQYYLEKSQEMGKIGTWELDVGKNELKWTKESYRICGVPFGTPMTYELFLEIVHPDDRVLYYETLNRELKEHPLELEHRLIVNNEVKWVKQEGQLEFDAEGNTIKAIGFTQDITKRKLSEDKIWAAERNLKETFDISPGIICTANLTLGYFTEANQAVTRILGYSVEEFTSKPLLEFIHPDDKQRTADEITEQQNGAGVVIFENRYLCKDGSYKWLAWNCTKADKEGRITAIGSDINEKKIVEQEIVETKQFYENVIEGVQDGIWVTDKNDVIYYANSAMERIAGVPREEFQGKNIFYDFLEETTGELLPFYQQAKKEKKPIWYDVRVITPAKRDSCQNGWLIPQFHNNLFLGVICSARDVTERKQTEKELIDAKEKAEESDRLKSAFLANMSHEIRTPMNGILGFLDLLLEPNLSQTQINEYTAIINTSSNRLLTTINDIIDISKIEAGQVLVTQTEISLNKELDELHAFHLHEAQQKGISLFSEPSLSGKQALVLTDNHKLHGILTNLIKNAIKYTDAGAISFGYVLKGNFLEFFVKDTGIGIPENRLDAIFNRFEQADIEDKRAYEGSGLGLAISKAYTEMLGGEIWAESEEGKGTKFVFTIPYVGYTKKEMEQLPGNIGSESTRIENLNVLIVEDDIVSSEFFNMILKNSFGRITFAENGIEAIETCKKNKDIDLVLMDIKMPKMNGYDATRQIRMFNNEVVIIAQTAYSMPDDKEKAMAAGCNDYISKPINKQLLFEMIKKHLK